MGRRIVRVPHGFQHPTDESGEPIPGAHLELLWGTPVERLTNLQVYEDVSEGTPVSPNFASSGELREWLIAQGVAGQAADDFLREGSASSFVLGPEGLYAGGVGMVGPSPNGKGSNQRTRPTAKDGSGEPSSRVSSASASRST